jgi:hypothetical protein
MRKLKENHMVPKEKDNTESKHRGTKKNKDTASSSVHKIECALYSVNGVGSTIRILISMRTLTNVFCGITYILQII